MPRLPQLHENLAKVEEMYKGSVSVVYKHFPLDTKCNTRMTEAPHKWACDAAALAEAARVKGKFWEAHDAMFESVLADIAKDLDIEWQLPAGAAESDSRVQADIEAAIELGLDGTPAVFMNGRRVVQPIERALRLLLFYELTAVGQQGLDAEDAMEFDDHGSEENHVHTGADEL